MWREDFRRSELTLSYHTPEDFTRCFWQKSERIHLSWILYRVVIALYFTVTLFVSLFHVGRDTKPEDEAKYWIFLTNWTYIVETFQFFLAMVIVVERAVKERRPDFNPEETMTKMPWYYKMYWLFYTITIPASITVTCIFWAAVYDPQYNPLDVINITTHIFNTIFMVVDFVLVAHPYRIMHIYFPLCYGALYSLFSLIYQHSGGTGTEGKIPIYGILNWFEPGTALGTCAMAYAFLTVVHLLFWLFHKSKVQIKKNRSISSGGKKQQNKEGFENLGMDLRIV